MPEENMNQEFRLKKINKVRNYLIAEINRNELMSKKHTKFFRVLNYIDHSLIVISTITGCVSISVFASLVRIPIEIISSAIALKICVKTAEIKNYQSINKKNKKKYNKIISLAKSKLNSVVVLISRRFNWLNVSHDEFVSINNALKEFYDIKEEIKNANSK